MEDIEKMLMESPISNIIIAYTVDGKTHTLAKCDSWTKALNLTFCTLEGIIGSNKDDINLLKLSGVLHGAIEEIIKDVGGDDDDDDDE